MPAGNIWSGADPGPVVEGGVSELGSIVQALIPLTVTGVRIYGRPGPALPGRQARLWSPMFHTLITAVALPEVLPAGWFTVPVNYPMEAGDSVEVSYTRSGDYSHLANAFDASVIAPDGAMRFPKGPGNGRWGGAGGPLDNHSGVNGFYGVDVTYSWTGTPPPPPPPPPGSRAPNAEMVGVAWLGWLKAQGVTAAPAATSRPDPAGWAATGFLVVSAVGTAHDPDSPGWRVPVLSVDAWAYTPNGGKPPWGHAAALAQMVWDAAEAGLVPLGTLATGSGYRPVRVASTWPVTDIRRVPEPDGSSYAHYSLDVALRWVKIPA